MKRSLHTVCRFIKSPLARISFGLVMLTVSLLLISDLLGFMPDSRGTEIEFRQQLAESAALQVSMEIGERDSTKLQQILSNLVERNERVLGVGVRQLDGVLLHQVGDFAGRWTLSPQSESTVEQVRVALYSPRGEWGTVELALQDMPVSDAMFRGGSSVIKIVLYVGLVGFIGYFFFLKRVMRELDPDQVLPDRVRTALDSLTDGLLIMNHDGVIMFCNKALARKIGINAKKLIGRACNDLDWVDNNNEVQHPWQSVLLGEKLMNEQALNLRVGHHQSYQFVVNATVIKGENKEVRGAMVTFNDVTELERKHAELEITLANLEETQVEIEQKNKELFKLATRDPLTNLFNRRAFFDAFETHFETALKHNTQLGCIMLDIDHFKSVNDTYGHTVGDAVIQYLATTLTLYSADLDVVARFGGEEFCVVIPDASIEEAVRRAEQIREHVEQGRDAPFAAKLNITSSFGVAVMPSSAKTPGELIELADMALYEAKTGGRNRVASWQGDSSGRRSLRDNVGAAALKPMQTPAPAPVEQASNAKSAGAAKAAVARNESDLAAINVRTAGRRLEEDPNAPGALVLVESGQTLSQRHLLAANVDTAINRARRFGHAMAVIVFDGDSLQYIADNVDYNIGNKLCSVLVDRIKNLLRLADVVSQGEMDDVSGSVTRSDNNEIAVLLTDIDSKTSIPGIVERLLAVFDQRIVISGMEYVVDTHAGISILGEDGNSAEALLQNACVACSSARMSEVRNSYSFYSQEMDKAAKRYIRLQSDLHKAAEQNELEVLYQPKMDVVTGDLLGFEALLRWHHSKLGTVSPIEFIPIAEKTGLIHTISAWVFTEVVDQIARWQDCGFTNTPVAVNVSALQLKHAGFAEDVLGLAEQAGIPGAQLEVEITESIGIDELDIARGNLEKLNAGGVAVSIDDFGTGYASLGYLQHFPITRLKIDRLFVSGCTVDEKKARVVRSIITMGNSLGMRVLAEGVETAEQLLFLRDHHCDEVQGYLMSKPVNAEKATQFVEHPVPLSQVILATSMGRRRTRESNTMLPLSGLDAVLSRFPDAANDDASANSDAKSGTASG